MRKVIITAFVSLDGIMQAPGGPDEDPTGGFRFGGWTVPFWDDSLGAEMGEVFSQPFDLLLGRKTYDIFNAHWPHVATDPSAPGYDAEMGGIASLFNQVTKYVATRSPQAFSWRNTVSLGADVPRAIRELKQQNGPTLLIQGSSDLLQTLLQHDLLDEIRLLIFPLVLGKGKRFFGSGTVPAGFKLIKATTAKPGVIVATYHRAGEIQTGSFALENPTQAELERRRHLT